MDTKRRASILINIFGLYTILTYLWVLTEFFSRGAAQVPVSVSAVYLAALTLYVGDKEIRRLRRRHKSPLRHGEYYVYLWAISFIAISLFVLLEGRKMGFSIPADLATNAGVVLILYFVTDVNKTRRLK